MNTHRTFLDTIRKIGLLEMTQDTRQFECEAYRELNLKPVQLFTGRYSLNTN